MPALLEKQVEELRDEIKRAETEAARLRTEADKIRDDAVADGKNPLTDDSLFAEYDARTKESDSNRQRALDLRARLEGVLGRAAGHEPGSADTRPLNRQERRAFAKIAERYLQSDTYQALLRSGSLKSGNAHIMSDPVEVLDRSELMSDLRQRTTVSVGDAGAVVPIDQQVWPPIEIPVRQPRLLDMISMTTTDSDMVNFVQQTVRSDVATPVPYGTPAPEADYEFALRQASVKRMPQFIPATKDVLADQGQLQGLLQDQLMMGVRLGIEAQFLAGTGSGFTDQTFQGIVNTSGIGVVTYQDAGHASEYELDAIHRAITTIRLTLFADPTAIGIHPTSYEAVVLRKDSYGRYLYPVGTETNTIWGLQPVISPVFTVGQPVVGDYKTGARMWLREGLSVTASTEHLDFFTRGMVAILAELRAAFAVVQPRAFCLVNNLT
ncbi:phage major capsid protein [Acidiferrimicrobium sp. IK]|uniref:phage major capsid protein n=1 Tax=Acidiferrimicrobium sp. IK TaxID=2871700 RepID=UPI0021CB7773|nr:phage major capsid protein [Acidiferrimicrobium sp. IK]MCU4184020.1 phage major capsid protein [Acidiferrimicrobium sp. IK]